MTGFARQSGSLERENFSLSWVWEIKSVNGKNLDLKVRLPLWLDEVSLNLRNIAAGQGQFRIMFSGQKRPQHVVGSAHFAHVVVRCDQAFSLGCLVSVHFARIAVDYFVTTVNLCAELFQQQIHGANVGKGRHVGQGDAFPGEEGGAYQRQRRIFGAADVDLTGEPVPAVNL